MEKPPEFKKSFWERALADNDPEAIAFLKRIGHDADAMRKRIGENCFTTREGYRDDSPMLVPEGELSKWRVSQPRAPEVA